jgi:hypothetical protein
MSFLKQHGFRGVALSDLQRYTDLAKPPADPALNLPYPKAKYGCPDLPVEVLASRADLGYWLENTLRYHRYTLSEAAEVCGLSEIEVERKAADFGLYPPPPISNAPQRVRVLPYPGGRHPRSGFLEGAINPMRGTKASIFLPWDPTSYVVVDLPEAIFSNLGLIFLANTHIPTIWNDQNMVFENIDWNRGPDGGLSYQRTLPNGIVFGASIQPVEQHVEMEVWLRNFSGQNLTGLEMQRGLRTQVCVMLKGAPEFNSQTSDNKTFRSPVAAVRSDKGSRWILTAWEHCGHVWGNPPVPCLHSDPELPECPFGKTVRARGRLWSYEGTEIGRELDRAGMIRP